MAVKEKGVAGLRTRDNKKAKEPNDYIVVLLNDDYTTMEFVVEVLKRIFHKNDAESEKIMLNVHNKGRGVVGVYAWDIAQTKVAQVHEAARKNEFPLRCIVEEA
jgi:ATP-dependent Clp protease adaptor protein ClpS